MAGQFCSGDGKLLNNQWQLPRQEFIRQIYKVSGFED
jgi:hypothetical protein